MQVQGTLFSQLQHFQSLLDKCGILSKLSRTILLHFLLFFCFETGSRCVTLAVLEHIVYDRLSSKSRRCTCLYLMPAGINPDWQSWLRSSHMPWSLVGGWVFCRFPLRKGLGLRILFLIIRCCAQWLQESMFVIFLPGLT